MVCLRATLTSFIHVLPPFVASTLDVPPVSSHEAVPRSRFQTPEASPRRVPSSAIVGHRPSSKDRATRDPRPQRGRSVVDILKRDHCGLALGTCRVLVRSI